MRSDGKLITEFFPNLTLRCKCYFSGFTPNIRFVSLNFEKDSKTQKFKYIQETV